jgi:hypothetical protein
MRATLRAAAGVELAFELPEGAQARPAVPFDPSSAPGVVLAASRGWTAEALEIDAGCVSAPGWLWAPGLEGPALSGASGMVGKATGLSLEPGALAVVAGRVEQQFVGRAGDLRAEGRHLLGSADGELVACSLVCREPIGGDACAPLVAALQVEGALGALPEAGLVAGALGAALAHPRAALFGGALVIALAVAWILRRRPRPRA